MWQEKFIFAESLSQDHPPEPRRQKAGLGLGLGKTINDDNCCHIVRLTCDFVNANDVMII